MNSQVPAGVGADTPSDSARTLRRSLLALFLFGALGTGTELLLLGHNENLLQWQPLILLAATSLIALCCLVRASRLFIRLYEALGALCIASGLTGLWQHYRGNVEFEIEMEPNLAGFELFGQAIRGATPFLAPGALALLGIISLMYAYKHPNLQDPKP